ncbi:MAG: nicotinate-nucleotide--dimethylbenzimidazole phosphoribosyltransferase [Nitrospirae bacterium]|nr:nicotinate-nucleotide--dimethylbenzimidazole phosphoribosyltransferase [Nitrospirota bacterium]MBI3352745.1 nicotinate-nucleotide--dimethylbenzimidazole phosphoribosyltransferase [Nitrospirota bacterium]
MDFLRKTLQEIQKPDQSVGERIQRRLDRLTKPPESLGRLEELAVWYGMSRGEIKPTLDKKAVVVFAADHGIADEGVSAFPREVTAQMVYNFLRGGAGINVLSRHVNAEVIVVDIGVAHDFEPAAGLRQSKVKHGTANMSKGPAMSPSEMLSAIREGILLSEELARKGIDLLATGEMGIANTTASSAITAVITSHPVAGVTGRGTGVNDTQLNHKIKVIEKALQQNLPQQKDPLDVLAKVGGLEIAGLVGLILGAARNRIPVVLDGFISGAAALIAVSLNPLVKEYLSASHQSVEPGHRLILDWLGLVPLLNLNLRLGEGTGAVLGMGLVEAGVKVLSEMATFDEAGVSDKEG